MKNKFNGFETNVNRAEAGSERGLACRNYPILIAERLNHDPTFVAEICRIIKKRPSDFNSAVAGSKIPAFVASAEGGTKKTRTKTNLRIIWKDARYTNFRVKHSGPSQIHLEITDHFFKEYEAQFGIRIPSEVKEALLLFSGRHPEQKRILDSISVNYVGDRVRDLERKYNNRLTLASMHGYKENIVSALLDWLRNNIVDIFEFCFSKGAAREYNLMSDYLWYHDEESADSKYKIYSIRELSKKLRSLTAEELVRAIRPNDSEQVGSTIALPFGNLQYHLFALQFRQDPEKIEAISRHVYRLASFGSRPKMSGHENELKIAQELNLNKKFRAHFCDRIGKEVSDFVVAEAGGIHAKQEDSVLGGKTVGKTDLTVRWKDGEITNVSIKKRSSGQVYLVTAKNFVEAYEAQYHAIVPSKVRRALAFFIGEDPESRTILEATDISIDGQKARDIAIESNYRLMFDVIRNFDSRMAHELLVFLKDQISDIFELCFAAGAVKDRKLWSNILWYKNLVDADGQALDYLVPIPMIKVALIRNADQNVVEPGPQNAGSTIHLPFGHVQYHLKQLEFYQKLKKIQQLITCC